MDLRESTWPVLDALVEREVEDLGATTRRRYQRAAHHLLGVLTTDDVPGELGPDVVRSASLLLADERLPTSSAVARTYVLLVSRLVDHLGPTDEAVAAIRAARERVETARIERPPDPWATRIPDRLKLNDQLS